MLVRGIYDRGGGGGGGNCTVDPYPHRNFQFKQAIDVIQISTVSILGAEMDQWYGG